MHLKIVLTFHTFRAKIKQHSRRLTSKHGSYISKERKKSLKFNYRRVKNLKFKVKNDVFRCFLKIKLYFTYF